MFERTFTSCLRMLAPLLAVAALAHPAPAAAQIVVGLSSGLTGLVAAGVKENVAGAQLYIDHVNAGGGVNGERIDLQVLDDGFDPKRTVDNARRLVTDKRAVALFMIRGTPHSQAVLPLLAEFGVPLVAPSTGAMVLHEPVNRWVFNVRAPYQREAAQVVRHLSTVGLTRIGIAQTDDSFGADATVGAQKGFAAAGQQPLFVEKFDRAKPDFAAIVKRATEMQAQAMLFFGSSGAVAAGTKALREAGSGAQVVTLSNNASDGFIKLLGEHGRGVIVTQVFPNERSMASPLVKEAILLARARPAQDGAALVVSPAMLEGFAGAKVLVEGLRRAGPAPTRQALQQALEGMRRYDIGGLEVGYAADDHTGLEFTDLSIISADGRFKR